MYYENEKGYIELLKDVLNNGEEIQTRNGVTISKFGYLLKFTNIDNFPLLNKKKVF